MKFLLSLVLLFVSGPAFAQAMTEAQITAAKAVCVRKYNVDAAAPAMKVSIALAQDKCKLEVDVIVLQTKAQASGQKNEELEKRLAEQKASIERMNAALERLEKTQTAKPAESAAKQTAQTPAPTQSPRVTVVQQAPTGAYPQTVGGAPFSIIEMPGQLVASTREIVGMNARVKFFALWTAVQMWLGRSANEVRVVVIKDGDVLAISNPNKPGEFTEFYADLRGRKYPDPKPYKGVDPSLVDSIYVASELGSVIELVFLTRMGNKFVNIPGLPPQPLWGNPLRVHFDPVRDPGRVDKCACAGYVH